MKSPAGYSGTPLWKKLGYKDGLSAFLDGAPARYVELLTLPTGMTITWLPKLQPKSKFIHIFSDSRSNLESVLRCCRKKIAPDGVIWVSWPKKSSKVKSDITEDVIREVGFPLNLVDIKVCAVDDTWSGLKLMVRKEQR